MTEKRAFAFTIPFPKAGRLSQTGPDIDQETSLCLPGWLIQLVENILVTDKRSAPLLATPLAQLQTKQTSENSQSEVQPSGPLLGDSEHSMCPY